MNGKIYIEINRQNLLHNLGEFTRITDKPIIFVVKGNAYGHGLKEVVAITRELDFIEYYAVDSLQEALIVESEKGRQKVLLLGWCTDEEIRECIRNGFEMVAPSREYFIKVGKIAGNLKLPARVQIKIETGTSRLGMFPEEAIKCINRQLENIEITGVYSHFANIEDTLSHDYAFKQLKIFNDMLKQMGNKKITSHFSCSAASLLFPMTHFDLIRVGIAAYGFWPSKETYISYYSQQRVKIELKPVLTWYSKIAQVKDLKEGQGIGYGVTYKTFAAAQVAVIPVGYYDGYPRSLSNVSTVLIRGVRAPVRGRVCMNMIIAETTHIKNVAEGDEVILLGSSGSEEVGADDLAKLSGSINYEIIARINPKIPKVIV
jgi:alanine racemase